MDSIHGKDTLIGRSRHAVTTIEDTMSNHNLLMYRSCSSITYGAATERVMSGATLEHEPGSSGNSVESGKKEGRT